MTTNGPFPNKDRRSFSSMSSIFKKNYWRDSGLDCDFIIKQIRKKRYLKMEKIVYLMSMARKRTILYLTLMKSSGC